MKYSYIILLLILYSQLGVAQKHKDFKQIIAQCEEQMDYALELYSEQRCEDRFLPRNTEGENETRMVSSSDWTSGFFPGSLWSMYDLTGQNKFRKQAEFYTERLVDQQYNKGTHDTGFMMYCSYGQGIMLGKKKEYAPVILETSNSLISRYNSKVGCIRSWDHHSDLWRFPVIIDNMMNLEMLCWASKYSGDQRYLNVAIDHANTTMENHFRADNSSFHVVDYIPETGKVHLKQTNQGISDDSAWARGQTWGLYGYTVMYRETGDVRYLQQAEKIAELLISHPALPEDHVPYWDFNDPGIPNVPRDASAGAILASGLFELQMYSKNRIKYYQFAESIMLSLCTSKYLAKPGTNQGFLLRHSTGNMPINSEVDEAINYADYYFLEALRRWQKSSSISSISEDHTIRTLTDDGAWCWFSDPRAIYVHGTTPGVLTGWVKADGTIESSLVTSNIEMKTDVLASKLDKDDHANPSFVELDDDEYSVFYTKHFDNIVRIHLHGKGDEDLFGELISCDPFSKSELEKFPLKRTTYANPYKLSKEDGNVYCFGRWTGFKPNVMVSKDGGKIFDKARVMITNYPFDSNNRPYAKYYSDGKSKIHIVFTDGHPRNESLNSVYYAYYEKGSFWKADGSKICDFDQLPFEPKDASVVYQATKEKGKSWVFDVSTDKKGNPIILYARYPDDRHHMYQYLRFDGKEWNDHAICDAGKWFPQTPSGKVEREPNYSGALVVHPLKPNEVYTSEQVEGIFEIVKYTSKDQGQSWERKPITSKSTLDNVRPVIPKNMKSNDPTIVMWMKNRKYVHYTDYSTSIEYYVEN